LTVQLEQSPFLSLISNDRIRQTLVLMGRPGDAPLTPEIAREICERTASAAVLEGSIAPIGSQYVLGLSARNCRSGDVLDEEQVQAAKKEDVLNALSQIATKFRTRVGESLATVEKHSTPLAEATTASLDALQAYSTALKVFSSGGDVPALPFFRRAVEIDPKFAMAHGWLGRMYGDTEDPILSAESTSKAWQLRDRRVWSFTTNQVAALTLRRSGSALQLLRGPMGEWKIESGSSGIINTFAVISRQGACSAKSLYLPNNDSSTSALPRYLCRRGTFAPSFRTNANTCRRNAVSFPAGWLSPARRRLIRRQLVRRDENVNGTIASGRWPVPKCAIRDSEFREGGDDQDPSTRQTYWRLFAFPGLQAA